MTTATPTLVNGLDTAAVRDLINTVDADPAKGLTHWRAVTRWEGGCVTRTHIAGYRIGGRHVERNFDIATDEPVELGGANRHANPQDHLLAALNACMTVTWVVLCSLQGIKIESLQIETTGDIDLRGLFDLDDTVAEGYEQLRYTVRIKGDADEERFRQVHDMVKRTSPNYYNLARAVALDADLIVE